MWPRTWSLHLAAFDQQVPLQLVENFLDRFVGTQTQALVDMPTHVHLPFSVVEHRSMKH